jgi:hypothetical protein
MKKTEGQTDIQTLGKDSSLFPLLVGLNGVGFRLNSNGFLNRFYLNIDDLSSEQTTQKDRQKD